MALAEAVSKACRKPNNFHFLYPLDLSIKEKIEIIVRQVYGGAGVEYLPEAEKKIAALHARRASISSRSAWLRPT